MSSKRVVLLALLAMLILPAAAFADGVTFGFQNGRMFSPRPSAFVFAPATNNPSVNGSLPANAPAKLVYVTRFAGSPPPGTPAPPTFGQAPDFFSPNPFNFGTVTFTTGLPTGSFTSTSLDFGAGGAISIVSNLAFQTATGGAVPAGTTLFSGFFSGITTLTQVNFPSPSCSLSPTCLATFNFHYTLTGPVQGTLHPSLVALLNLGSTSNSSGFLFTLQFGFIGPTDNIGNPEGGFVSVLAPEPGTLALFGTGLIGLAGVLRRRLNL